MQEQVMVTDALNSINSGLKSMADMIAQTENPELRQTLIQMRNDAEKCQFELYSIAKQKNYYQPAQKASEDQIMKVKNYVTNQSMSSGQSQATNSMGSGMNSTTHSMGR